MVDIYILKCENNKYYIGSSNNIENRIKNHFNGNGSIWTKKYKPIEVVNKYYNCDNFDEDKYTKIFMEKYGIDNVRGGSYATINLTDDTINMINKELQTKNNTCFHCGKAGHFAKYCYKLKYSKKINEKSIDVLYTIKLNNKFINYDPTLYHLIFSDAPYVWNIKEYNNETFTISTEIDGKIYYWRNNLNFFFKTKMVIANCEIGHWEQFYINKKDNKISIKNFSTNMCIQSNLYCNNLSNSYFTITKKEDNEVNSFLNQSNQNLITNLALNIMRMN